MSAQSVYPGQHQGKLKKETVAPLQAESFDLKSPGIPGSCPFQSSDFRPRIRRQGLLPAEYGIYAVSYTHLDVYKRQLLHAPCHIQCNFFDLITQLLWHLCKYRNDIIGFSALNYSFK